MKSEYFISCFFYVFIYMNWCKEKVFQKNSVWKKKDLSLSSNPISRTTPSANQWFFIAVSDNALPFTKTETSYRFSFIHRIEFSERVFPISSPYLDNGRSVIKKNHPGIETSCPKSSHSQYIYVEIWIYMQFFWKFSFVG